MPRLPSAPARIFSPLPPGEGRLPRLSRVLPLLIIGGLWLCLVPDPVLSAEPQTPEASVDETTPSSVNGHHANPREVALGFGMLAAILIVGVLLLLVVVLWGNRTRRLARSPLPPVTKQDELWYLKPKKPEDESQAEPPASSPGPVPPQPREPGQ